MNGRLHAVGRLAGLYARHVARRVVIRARPGDGLRAFEALYTPDRITAVTAEERDGMAEHGRCIGCGLCGFAAPAAGYLRSERLPLQLTRHLPDLWTLRDLDLAAVDWAAAEAVCPMGVPHAAMVGLVRDRLARDGVEPPVPREPGPLVGASRR